MNERINAMTEIMIRLGQTEQEFVAFNVSNEALEAAAGTVREKAASELHTRGLQRFICLPRLSRLFDWS
jgi:hypothetical protein